MDTQEKQKDKRDPEKEAGVQTEENTKQTDEETVCFHPMQARVRTHRGFHCGNCGKRF